MPRRTCTLPELGIVKKKSKCKKCSGEILKGEKAWRHGSKVFCLPCGENFKRQVEINIALSKKKNKSSSDETKREILQGIYNEEGKLLCPICKTQEKIKVIDYGMAKNAPDKYYFLWLCDKCKVQFDEIRDRV